MMNIIYFFVGKQKLIVSKVVSRKLYHQSKSVYGVVPTSNSCSHLSCTHLKQKELLIRSSEHLACCVLSSSL